MQGQLTNIIQDNLAFGSTKEARQFVQNNVEVIPDIRTVRGENPAYQIVRKSELESGGLVVDNIKDIDGNQLFWVPTYANTPEAKRRQKQLDQEQEETRAKFEKQRKKNAALVKEFGTLPKEGSVLRGPAGATVTQSVRAGF